MNIHNVVSYVHNFDLSDKFQVVFEAHGSSFILNLNIRRALNIKIQLSNKGFMSIWMLGVLV